ncbi:hypothetical protein BU23DRAFT_567314 [Bimuria novae-zelandiae CBS 107.79]|uniref:Uncharacterized protein n=1 Tax=Bimuria novae-zelandiae CBS 107.79 TaxID=1447943 RepID=A0A6A5VEU2_9PLEO|nr:hypothetical protein BU23DRAFT_567314 [Bimuria novae-zelandiae CBS 107.79]
MSKQGGGIQADEVPDDAQAPASPSGTEERSSKPAPPNEDNGRDTEGMEDSCIMERELTRIIDEGTSEDIGEDGPGQGAPRACTASIKSGTEREGSSAKSN